VFIDGVCQEPVKGVPRAHFEQDILMGEVRQVGVVLSRSAWEASFCADSFGWSWP
jgi:hypothetical protein